FTTLCPITGQPDFAHLVIDYLPAQYLVESKSLKLYLNSFRNHGAFHEDCTVAIGKKLNSLLKPKWLRIGGYWYPRGGMPIDVFWQSGKLPEDVWGPGQGVVPYRGRGSVVTPVRRNRKAQIQPVTVSTAVTSDNTGVAPMLSNPRPYTTAPQPGQGKRKECTPVGRARMASVP